MHGSAAPTKPPARVRLHEQHVPPPTWHSGLLQPKQRNTSAGRFFPTLSMVLTSPGSSLKSSGRHTNGPASVEVDAGAGAAAAAALPTVAVAQTCCRWRRCHLGARSTVTIVGSCCNPLGALRCSTLRLGQSSWEVEPILPILWASGRLECGGWSGQGDGRLYRFLLVGVLLLLEGQICKYVKCAALGRIDLVASRFCSDLGEAPIGWGEVLLTLSLSLMPAAGGWLR